MQQISLVVALNYEYVIGSNNQLPWHIPEDLAHFKQLTWGKPIIMGRKTFESIGRVLPGRTNIVISRSGFSYPGVVVVNDLAAALAAAAAVPELMIIGGGEIFKAAIPLATRLYLTWVDYPVIDATTWFPCVNLEEWRLISDKQVISQNGIKCNFCEYHRLESTLKF